MSEQSIALALDVVNLALNHLGQKKVLALDNTTELGRKINMAYVPARDEALRDIRPNFAKTRALFHQVVDSEKSISGATAASPVVITSASHGLSNGDMIAIYSVLGMTDLNGLMYEIANVTTNTFSLKDINGTAVDGTDFDAYISGGKFGKLSTAPAFGYNYRYLLPSDYIFLLELNGNDANDMEYSIEDGELLTNETSIQGRYIYRHTDPSAWDPDFVLAFSYNLAAMSAIGITNLSKLMEVCNTQYETKKAKAKGQKSQESGNKSGPPRTPIITQFLNARMRQ